jgi:hypothetical protein
MPKRAGGRKARGSATEPSKRSSRTGVELPGKESIVATDTLISPKGRRYTIIETNQMDPYDSPGGGGLKRGPKKRGQK